MSDSVWRRLDRRVKAARARAEEAPDEHGWRASRNLNELRGLESAIQNMIDAETIRGRDQGASWSMLGTSKQQAQQRYRRAVGRQPVNRD